MFGFGKKLTLPGAGEALPGREVAMRVPEKHYVNGHALRPPFPEGFEIEPTDPELLAALRARKK